MKKVLLSTALLLGVVSSELSAFDLRASYKTTELSTVSSAVESESLIGSFSSYGLGISSYSRVEDEEVGAGFYINVYNPTESEYGQSLDGGFTMGYTFFDMLTPKLLLGGEAQVLNETTLAVAYTVGAALELELFEHLIADVTYKYNNYYARLDKSSAGGFENIYKGSDLVFGLGYRF